MEASGAADKMLFVLLSRVNMVLLPMVAGLGGQGVIVQDII